MRRYFLSIRRLFVLGAVCALAVSVGCGGDDGGTSSAEQVTVETGSLSKGEFIERADAICEEEAEDVRRAGVKYITRVENSERRFEEQRRLAPYVVETVLVPKYEEQIERVSELGAPDGDAEQVAAVLQAIRDRLGDALDDPVDFLQEVEPFEQATRLGKAYGFKVCGQL
jgi:hypothetical protein